MMSFLIQDGTTWIGAIASWTDTLQLLHWHMPFELAALGDKMIENTFFSDVQGAFNNFVKTGQVWALLIGVILGYMIRSFTSYG